MRKIALPFDGSEAALRALDFTVRLAKRFKSPVKIDLINVQEATVGIPDSFARDATAVGTRLAEAARNAGADLLAKPSAKLKKAKLLRNSAVLLGDPAACIAEYVADNGCDAVVMGTRGRSQLAGLVLGSVATRVIYLATVPVTLVK